MHDSLQSVVSPVQMPCLAEDMRTPQRSTDGAHAPDTSEGGFFMPTLALLNEVLHPKRRVLREGDKVYQAGEPLGNLYVLNCGLVKIVNLASDGREQLVSLKLRGDWLGFDGMATGRYSCDALALDTSELWTFSYTALLTAGRHRPELLTVLHQAMSREIARERDAFMSVCTLPADARVAEFLHHWVQSLSACGLRTDAITLRMTRAEIGNYLGMTLESVSRALSKLARCQVIQFVEKRRRDVRIPDMAALTDFIQQCQGSAALAAH